MYAKNMIENKIGEELCKLPLKTKQSCEDVNISTKQNINQDEYKQKSNNRLITFQK